MPRLKARDGRLVIPFADLNCQEAKRKREDRILFCIYPEGDCDSCRWPFESEQDKKNLEAALFDEGNLETIEPGPIYLPDGSLFGEVVSCGFHLNKEISHG